MNAALGKALRCYWRLLLACLLVPGGILFGPLYSSFSGKALTPEDMKGNVGAWAAVSALSLGVWLLFALWADVGTMYHFGISQRMRNMVSFDIKMPVLLKGDRKVYPSWERALEQGDDYSGGIVDGSMVYLEGDVELEYITLLAVSYYEGISKHYGYVIEGKGDTRQYSQYLDTVEECLEDSLRNRWLASGKALYAEEDITKQHVVDADDLRILKKVPKYVVYCKAADYEDYQSELEEALRLAPSLLFQNGASELWGKKVRGTNFLNACPLE